MAVVICPKTLDWDYMKQRPQQLMIHLANLGHTVFFENASFVKIQFQEIEENVFLYSDVAQLLRFRLPKLRQTLPIVVWAMAPYPRSRIHLYDPNYVIYDCCDDFPQISQSQYKITPFANHIVCSANILAIRLSLTYPDKPVTIIRNGVESLFFNGEGADRPTDWPSGDVVGYVGAFSYWLDHALIRFLANRFPSVTFMMIGAKYGDVPIYEDLPNVRIIGEIPHNDLTNYIRHFKVGIIPFAYHPITLGTNPIKAYEYLAAGIRVLSTAIPECILMEPHVMTATTHQDFAYRLEFLLSTDDSPFNRDARIEFAKQNTWYRRALQADEVIQSLQVK